MPELAREMIAAARAIEIEQNSGATGFTLLKFCRTPIDQLVSQGRIGPWEFEAANEFSKVFEDITRGLRSTHSFGADLPTFYGGWSRPTDDIPPTNFEIEAWRHYKEFANYWSARRKRLNDKTLSVFVAAVIDQQPFEHIAQDNGFTVHKAEQLVIRGLCDYARRAGWR